MLVIIKVDSTNLLNNFSTADCTQYAISQSTHAHSQTVDGEDQGDFINLPDHSIAPVCTPVTISQCFDLYVQNIVDKKTC